MKINWENIENKITAVKQRKAFTAGIGYTVGNLMLKGVAFLSIPILDVGTPVFRAKLCLAPVIPKSLFSENENPNFPIPLKFIQQYLIQMVEVVIHSNQ